MPIATVAAIISNRDNHTLKILLTRRNVEPFKGKWCLPGGHIDPYEPAKEAVIREVKEETGLTYDARFFRYFDEILPDLGIHAVVLTFAGPARGILGPPNDEASEARWFSINQSRSLPLAFTHNEILDTYASHSSGQMSPP